ncbi:MAG: hypothetical protein LGB55_00860 [Sulfurovum sp.]|nr:hypothetical protein [Sulfurovum sp.]
MENIFLLTTVLIILELFEAIVQRAHIFGDIIKRLYVWYHKSIFLFFLAHPTFYFTLFVVIATDILNFSMIMIIAMKVFDIFYKLELIKVIYIHQKVPDELSAILQWHIPSWFFFTGVILYPSLLFLALA